MTVYVDGNMEHGVHIDSIRGQSCHLICDGTADELHRFAASIGLRRAWYSDITQPKSHHLHYDLVPSKCRLALAKGAVSLDYRQLADVLARCVKQQQKREA
jgi:hypothetical protein